MSSQLLLCRGARLSLGPRIGRGGEGEIYRITDGSRRAVKIYLKPDDIRETKVRAMISAGLARLCPNVAFPLDLACHSDGRFAGFIMAEIEGHQPIHELIGSGSRRQYFPDADWRLLLRVATNVARVVAIVHSAGIVIGDINSAGFLVNQHGLVTLIDADSFQVGTHRCRVGMPEYTPPELQGARFGDVDRTTEHDAFGLAVMLFQLLALGRHPFAGVTRGRPLPLEKAIAEGRFAYSQIRETGVAPPPHSLGLGDLPRAIRLLFERAFAPHGGRRPTASEWAHELSLLEAALVPCTAKPYHVVASPASCPWCRIERETGRPAFKRKVASEALREDPDFTILRDGALRAVRLAKRRAGEDIDPPWHTRDLPPSAAARELLVVGHVLSPWEGQVATFIDEEYQARVQATTALKKWRTGLGVWEVYKHCDNVERTLKEVQRLRTHRPSMLAHAKARVAEEQMTQLLSARSLRNAGIAGIGGALEMQLAHCGIVSAADISRDRLAAIRGLGERRIVALLFWRESAAVAAERHKSPLVLKTGLAEAAATQIDLQLSSLEGLIQRQLGALENTVRTVLTSSSRIDVQLRDTLRGRDCGSACKKDPLSGVIGVQKGPLISMV